MRMHFGQRDPGDEDRAGPGADASPATPGWLDYRAGPVGLLDDAGQRRLGLGLTALERLAIAIPDLSDRGIGWLLFYRWLAWKGRLADDMRGDG